jgi:hypothetical protein
MKKEIWKDINGYEGYYQVSSLGNVRSLDRKRRVRNGKYVLCKGKKLKNSKGTHYYRVRLSIEGKSKGFNIHRLVAKAFIHNPHNKKEVNHIDGNKLNNNLENLEWVTKSENEKHKYSVLGYKSPMNGKFGRNNPKTRKVIQYDKLGNLINIFYGLRSAFNKTNINMGDISMCCNNKLKTAGGYIWKYKNFEEE